MADQDLLNAPGRPDPWARLGRRGAPWGAVGSLGALGAPWGLLGPELMKRNGYVFFAPEIRNYLSNSFK